MVGLKVPGVNTVHKTLADGSRRTYYYHRPTGVRIKADPSDPAAFAAEVKRLDSKIPTTESTIASLIEAYRRSPEYQGLAASTRGSYNKALDWLLQGGDAPTSTITSKIALALRDKAFSQHKRRFANYVVSVGSLLWNWGRPRGHCGANPWEDVPSIRKPRDLPRANPPWEAQEIAIVLERATGGLRVAIALAAFTGLRQGDCITILRSVYRAGSIELNTRKRGRRVRVNAHPILCAIIEKSLIERGDNNMALVVNSRGEAFTESGFRASFFKLLRTLAAEGLIRPGLTFHGLRHTVGNMMAAAGCSTKQIAAVLGVTEQQARTYSDRTDQDDLAAAGMERLWADLQTKLQTGAAVLG